MTLGLHRPELRGRAAFAGLVAAAAALGFGSLAQAATYPESAYVDFSNDSANPTQLIPNPDPASSTPLALPKGDNIVSGTTGDFDNDYFSFTIAHGQELTGIDVLDGAPPADRTFIGITSGTSAPPISSFTDSSGNFVTATGLLGWSLFNADQIGHDILPDLGASSPANFPPFPGATGFSGPLGAGTYSMWVLDGDGPAGTPYSLNFAVASVPEPASWALMIGGFGFAGSILRRRRRSLAALPA
jgi:hypothetical protein